MGGANYDVVTEDLNRRRAELETTRTTVNQTFDRERETTNAQYDGKYREELKTIDGGDMGRAKLDLLEKERQQKLQDVEAARDKAIADVESRQMPEIKRLENQQAAAWKQEEEGRRAASLATVGADRLALSRMNQDHGAEPNNPDREPDLDK
jgi:hypothetical protein